MDSIGTAELDALIDALEGVGLDVGPVEDTSVRPLYSGRYMYGGTCLGFTTPDPISFMFKLGMAVARMEADEPDGRDLSYLFDEVRSDNMGLGSIVYFPHVSVDLESEADLAKYEGVDD